MSGPATPSPASAAALPTIDVGSREPWRDRARLLMIVLAVTTSLPAVLWGSLHLAEGASGPLAEVIPADVWPWFRRLALACAAAGVLVLARLQGSDALAAGLGRRRLRALWLAAFDLAWALVAPFAAPFLHGLLDLGGMLGWRLFFGVPSLIADLALAAWLAALIRLDHRRPVLAPVLVATFVLGLVAAFGGTVVWGAVPLAGAAAIAVEVLRARRAAG